MSLRGIRRKTRAGGFTLVETLVALALSVLVLAGAWSVFLTCLRWWSNSNLFMRASDANNQVIERLVYGSAGQGGLREADGVSVVTGTNGWTLTYRDTRSATNQSYQYNRAKGTLVYSPGGVVIGSNLTFASAATNLTASGVSLRVDLCLAERNACYSNSLSTFVQFRNYHDN
jgi:type II secretory pathway pseudopilin PulG